MEGLKEATGGWGKPKATNLDHRRSCPPEQQARYQHVVTSLPPNVCCVLSDQYGILSASSCCKPFFDASSPLDM